ncbi:hypothetical protein Tco_0078414, partial [Tanacetum coccineum]
VDDLVNKDNDSEAEEVCDEIATYMASTGFNVNKASKSGSGGGNKSLYEQWKKNHDEDPYNDFACLSNLFTSPSFLNLQVKT